MISGVAEAALQVALELERASTLSLIQDAVRAFTRRFGYDRFVLFSVSSSGDDLVDRIFWVEGNWWDDDQTVDAQTYVTRCPVTRHILEARGPFFWTKTHCATGDRYRIVRRPVGPGPHGLQVPVFGPRGLEGAMSLGGDHIDSSPDARLVLAIVATAAFNAARRLLQSPCSEGVRQLSVREREVLTWTAAGRRHADIAATLGLSERTVENHLRAARRRLGVATTAQAIKIAIRNGELGDGGDQLDG
ncbi:PA1136 family autoinducer-binding transcriptional regulator [Pseudomonas chlororaphis]|uniref:PA1136 family autoinducer-binding transcriptional regulator n=1 Tax=Pseudomonas chlororaphis TaxID=587753 RepID=UPI0003D31D9E|nr:PA1136 family autoinducer-binding transcriptional regulator [Pseudomonas chlororaphis]AZD29843.1 Transcriptional regulator, LuxR family [Pseudomonas chlororaphis]ETD39243.1 LuxR family transcriptional regulator [Pseudomonas chlororaphis subsp. aurantiaca PB-St2]QFS55289.1 LuxR family transcriptional regulator [Pseudomonas chlororaphis subsp. aurantiaca]